MSEDPGELQRFYAETVEPLVAYDEQYETDLERLHEVGLVLLVVGHERLDRLA